MNFRTIAKIGFVVVALPSTALAQHSGSAEDQMACTPDVYRLCAAKIPDEDAIVACLERNKAALSPGCQQVFSKPNPAPGQHSNDDDN